MSRSRFKRKVVEIEFRTQLGRLRFKMGMVNFPAQDNDLFIAGIQAIRDIEIV
jgi:hypothetical protein